MDRNLDLSFLTPGARLEFQRLYPLRENRDMYNLSAYCVGRAEMGFEIPEEVFEIIDKIKRLPNLGINIWFDSFDGFKDGPFKHVWLFYHFEIVDKEYYNGERDVYIEKINKELDLDFKFKYQTGNLIAMAIKIEDKNERELNDLLSIGWLVHPINEKVWGVYSSAEKIEKRFKKLKKMYPNAIIEESNNCCAGDYIIDLYGELL